MHSRAWFWKVIGIFAVVTPAQATAQEQRQMLLEPVVHIRDVPAAASGFHIGVSSQDQWRVTAWSTPADTVTTMTATDHIHVNVPSPIAGVTRGDTIFVLSADGAEHIFVGKQLIRTGERFAEDSLFAGFAIGDGWLAASAGAAANELEIHGPVGTRVVEMEGNIRGRLLLASVTDGAGVFYPETAPFEFVLVTADCVKHISGAAILSSLPADSARYRDIVMPRKWAIVGAVQIDADHMLLTIRDLRSSTRGGSFRRCGNRLKAVTPFG